MMMVFTMTLGTLTAVFPKAPSAVVDSEEKKPESAVLMCAESSVIMLRASGFTSVMRPMSEFCRPSSAGLMSTAYMSGRAANASRTSSTRRVPTTIKSAMNRM